VLTALLAFGATPAVLVRVVGNPLGQGLGHRWDHAGRIGLTIVVAVAWVAWGACCCQLLRAVVAQVRQGHVSTPVGAVLSDRIAGRIAAGVLAVLTVVAPMALGNGAGAAGVHAAVATVGNNGPGVAGPTVTAAPLPTVAVSYVVRPGDSLWSIAATQLGDGDDWPAIAALNLGRTMPDGLRFVDPNRIEVGWTLQLPDQRPSVVAPAETDDGPSDATPPADSTSRPGRPTRPGGRLTQPGLSRTDSAQPRHAVAHPATLESAGPSAATLPELAALGLGAIACAALARRSRRRRLLRQVTGESGAGAGTGAGAGAGAGGEGPLSPAAIDTDVLLARFSGVPALAAFEAANYELGAVHLGPGGDIRAICVGAAGVDFWLAQPGTPAPEGCTLSGDGHVWRVAHETFPAPGVGRPFLPVVLPIGEDESGTWLIPVPPGGCLPIVGEAAEALVRAALAAQGAWSWADMVLITDDPLLAAGEVVSAHGTAAGPVDATSVLYVGVPARLPGGVAPHVSVVTLGPGPSSDVTVLVDRRAASIHPLGRTVRPHLLDGPTSGLIGELVALPVRQATVDDEEGQQAAERADDTPPSVRPEPEATSSVASEAGTIEVRLLTTTPRLEGLRAALPPNRARRAVELVAYLALHAGDDVTSDRLRTRVLGSSDADAAAKTLFNIATAARRAMGTDASGMPLFPPGSRTGHYRVAPGVTTDVQRAASLAIDGSRAEDPEAAMALLRAALELVEGEPMANALSGYTWWDSEGHGARLAAVLVNAATDLAALAVDAGRFDLAQWGLAQARLVDPYSEALSRTAMQVAAAAGDADCLRREWRECQRRIDELDPGSSPSRRTERLYGELARHILVSAGEQ
jgi:DNA-binding SARP family transcriptional activator/LysM repeat protein